MTTQTEKAIVPGTQLCLLARHERVIEYTVVTCGIGISAETGNYQIGFWLRLENDPEEFVPDHMILNLLRTGKLWKKGQHEMAAFLRKKYPASIQ